MSKDCPNPFSNVTEDGKPREAYIPQEITDENELFQGIKSGSAFDNFDRVALQVSKILQNVLFTTHLRVLIWSLQVTGQDCPQYFSTFEEAGLRQLVLDNIKRSGYVKPTPVQKGAISVIMAKRDLIASAVTGSGKTVRRFFFFYRFD